LRIARYKFYTSGENEVLMVRHCNIWCKSCLFSSNIC